MREPSEVRMIDPTDPDEWGPAVERMAMKMTEMMWGRHEWYRAVANAALTVAFDGLEIADLDPKDTDRVCWEYFAREQSASLEASGA